MPEHDFDRDVDLDKAFAYLLEDVGGHTTPPPASTVIERSRRRRTTTVAAAAAVVVLAGGIAVASGVGRPTAAPGPSGQLPAAAVLDQQAWSAATAGWVDGWGPLSDSGSLGWIDKIGDPTCLATMPDNGPEPDRSGRLTLAAGDRAFSFSALADFDDAGQAQTSWRQLSDVVTGCGDAHLLQQVTWDGASGRSYSLDSAKQRQYLWLVREGQKMSITWYVGRTPALPDETDTRILTTLAAGLQDPGSFRENDDVTTDSGSSMSGESVSDDDFAQAIHGWDSGWKPASNTTSEDPLPCLAVDSALDSTGSFGGSLGSNGTYSTITFADAAAAGAALEDAQTQLSTCPTAYDVSTLTGTLPIVVASSPAGVAWIVQDGPHVGVIEIQGGNPDPPPEVSAAIAAVIDRALRTTTP